MATRTQEESLLNDCLDLYSQLIQMHVTLEKIIAKLKANRKEIERKKKAIVKVKKAATPSPELMKDLNILMKKS